MRTIHVENCPNLGLQIKYFIKSESTDCCTHIARPLNYQMKVTKCPEASILHLKWPPDMHGRQSGMMSQRSVPGLPRHLFMCHA